ncbi:MAG: ribosome silencing factor [Verrucomicrobiota bacterium]
MIEGEALALEVARRADDKQADDIRILDLRGISSITDYFVICTGTSMPHLKAIRREIDEKIGEHHGLEPYSKEGTPESHWVVIDYGDVIAHVFHSEQRAQFALEDLWSDARIVAFESSSEVHAAA